MVAFIDAHRGEYGVEPICAQLLIAPPTYHAMNASVADPTRRSARTQRVGAPQPDCITPE
jgi:putative transposase